jgi:phenylalanyl-tRNA synthetase beta chain
MIVSLSWLKEYVDIAMPPDKLAEALTMAGLEVELIYDRYEYLETVLIGRVVDISPHPGADHLKICTVDIKDQPLNVVCGAPNVDLNILSPVALPGTQFPDGTVLEKSSLRGQVSDAMLCSEMELGLGLDAAGLMILDASYPVGESLNSVLKLSDYVLEIGLTPNRPDCLSFMGVAREIAAIQNSGLKPFDATLNDRSNQISAITSVTLQDPDHCPRYTARLIEDVQIVPSPFWLQDRLASIGLRPINAIVDITNFVMMETGQPLHAFDFDRLDENRIVVRTATPGEQFASLDGKTRELTSEMLMICDGQKPVAIGGVMGGENSEIQDDTSRVLLESAYFNPISIRKTSKKLGLQTDASHRFERGTDPQGTVAAINRAAQLILEIAGGRLVEGLIDAGPSLPEVSPIPLNTHKTNTVLGTTFDQPEIQGYLNRLEFQTEPLDSENLNVYPPSFRVDVSRPEDLIEEVARLCGYQSIPTTFPLIPADKRTFNPEILFRDRVRTSMCGLGFFEVINYSFMNLRACDMLGLPSDDQRRHVLAISNPISEDQTVMRTTLLPGLISCMALNISQQVNTQRLYEIGNCFYANGQDQLPIEIERLAGLWTGNRFMDSWHSKNVPCDFFDLKGAVEGLMVSINIKDFTFSAIPESQVSCCRPGHGANIFAADRHIGYIGEVHPEVRKAFDLKQTAFVFEIDLNQLRDLQIEAIRSKPLSKFPAISRDITLIVDKTVEYQAVLTSIQGESSPIMESVDLFDAFEGDPIPKGQKSLSFRIVYRSTEKTLEDSDVSTLLDNTTRRIIKEFNADLPG